jgi:hypothetical protein
VALRHQPNHRGGGVSFEDLLKTLQQEYLSALPEKITRIRAQIDASSTTEVRESFHKL